MKRKLLVLAALLSGVLAYSQPTLTLHGFKQVIIPGTVPVGISPDGPPSAKIGPKVSATYFLYLAHSKSETIQPLQVWINKKAYAVKVEPVSTTPVEHINRNIPARPVKTVLVPKTSKKVVKLVPATLSAKTITPSATVKKLMETSELVVSYKWKGKTYHKALKTLKELEPEMAQ